MINGARVGVKIRYGAKEALANLYLVENTAIVDFDEPQRAATPGQAAVFYQNGIVIGGGVIANKLDEGKNVHVAMANRNIV